jgi:transposase-like protein
VAVVPATIEQLARDAVRIPDPETALRALGALRRELDETESELVIRALQTGASWAHIARALGVSKQAAHRKHRHLAEQLHLTPPEGGSKILVTVEARRAIQFAREETKRLGQPAIGTEHILLGILRCQQSPAVRALNALGVTHHAAKACIQPTMASTPTAAGAMETSAAPEQNVTAHARRILDGSLREAVKRHEGHIGVEHLLLALLADSRNGAVQTLEALKTTPSKVRRQLELEWQAISESGSHEAERGEVDDAGLEPATSALSTRRSPS